MCLMRCLQLVVDEVHMCLTGLLAVGPIDLRILVLWALDYLLRLRQALERVLERLSVVRMGRATGEDF